MARRGWVVLITVGAGAIVFALLVAARIEWAPFNIPSGSMLPTLEVGDYVFVRSYRFVEPQRGDVAVFLHQGNHYIKRLVGLAGETIQLRGGTIFINGAAVGRVRAGSTLDSQIGQSRELYHETLPNGVAYSILLAPALNQPSDKPCEQVLTGSGAAENTCPVLVPSGSFFMVGDNRDNSFDSRFADFGLVARDDLVGRADMIWWSRSASRIGKKVE